MQSMQNRRGILERSSHAFRQSKAPTTVHNSDRTQKPALPTVLMPLEQYHRCRIEHTGERHTEPQNEPTLYPYERPSPSSISRHSSRRNETQNRRIGTQNHGCEVTIWSEHEQRQAKRPSTEEALLEAQRKQLLRQHDWLGLRVSRPVQMDFSTRESRGMIGKRRKIRHDAQSRKVQLHNVRSPPFAVSGILSKDDCFMYGASAQQQPQSIEVGIGTAALQNQATPDRQRIEPPDYRPMLFEGHNSREQTSLLVSEANNIQDRSDVEAPLGNLRTGRGLSDHHLMAC